MPHFPTPKDYNPDYRFTAIEYTNDKGEKDIQGFHGKEIAWETHSVRVVIKGMLHYKAQSWTVYERHDHKYILHATIQTIGTNEWRGEFQLFDSIAEIQALLYAASGKTGPLGNLRRKLFADFAMRGVSKDQQP